MFRQTVIHHWLKIPDRWASCGRLVPSVRMVHVFAIIWAVLSSIFWIALVLSLWTNRETTTALLTHWIKHTSTLSSWWRSDSLQNYGWNLMAKSGKVHLCLKVLFLSISQDLKAFEFHCISALCALSPLPAAGAYLLCQCMTFKPAHYHHNSKFQHFSNSAWQVWSRQIHRWCPGSGCLEQPLPT